MSFSVLVPTDITPAMLTSCTIAEPAAGEALWVSGGTYTLGQQVIRASTHRVYEALIGMTGRTAVPELDIAYWLDVKPTQRYAALDLMINTSSSAPTTLTYVLQPGFFDAVAFYGLSGSNITVTVKDYPGGPTIASLSASLIADVPDFWDDIFGPYKIKDKVFFTNIEPSETAELTVTITGATATVGLLVVGTYRDFLYGAEWGGVQYGASADPKNYSTFDTDKEGNVKITEGRVTTDVSIRLMMSAAIAEYYTESVRDVLNTPACWFVSGVPGYSYLNVFGLGTGNTVASSSAHAESTIVIRGLT